MANNVRTRNPKGDPERKPGGRAAPALLRALGSVQLTLMVLTVFAVAIGIATFIETSLGSAGARALVYNAIWFEALLALLVINLATNLLLHFPYRPAQFGFVLTHVGFIVVLVAAAITRFYGYEGRMAIREGASTDFMYSTDDYVHLTVDEGTAAVPVRLYQAGKMGISHDLTVGDSPFRVSIEEYWPHAQTRLVEGEDGIPTVLFRAVDFDGGDEQGLLRGESVEVDGVSVQFVSEDPGAQTLENPRGSLHLVLGETTHHLQVPMETPAELEAEGFWVRIVEFSPDFKVGKASSEGEAMVNPAIRVEVRAPGGEVGERLLFAFHTDFDQDHAQHGAIGDIPMTYERPRRIQLYQVEGVINGRADFLLSVVTEKPDEAEQSVDIQPGMTFAVDEHTMLQSGAFAFVVTRHWQSAVEKIMPVDNEEAPAAVRLTIQDGKGNSAETVVQRWGNGGSVTLGDQVAVASFSPRRINLPYSLLLDDFVLRTYPGSSNPASYESHVRIIDNERGVSGEPVRIHMNHPLTYRGYKHFQSSYDPDRKGTVLSVNHDPGKDPTYVGYLLIGVGLLVTLSRRFWHRQHSGAVKKLSTRPKRAVAALVVLAGLGLAAASATATPANQGHGGFPNQEQPLPVNFLSEEAREALRTVVVQDFRGRMKPLDTLSRETIMKVTKRYHFDGWEPVDAYMSWLVQPRPWFERPFVAVRNPGVKEILEVGETTKHVSPASLAGPAGGYKLAARVEQVLRTPPRERDKTEQKLLSFDERLNVFDLVIRGTAFRVFPVPDSEDKRWIAPAELDSEWAAMLGNERVADYRQAWEALRSGIASRNNNAVILGAEAIRRIQSVDGANVVPGGKAMSAELWLNRSKPFTWVTIPYLIAFVLLLGAYTRGLTRTKSKRAMARDPLYLLGMVTYAGSLFYHAIAYTLRWIASGHAPLSNGYESLLLISVLIGVAGWYYESRGRQGATAALAALLTAVILGAAMLPTFDPAISPLQPVLDSYWLLIHVTVITASYGFLGLAAMAAMAILVMYLFKRPDRRYLFAAMGDLYRLHWNVMMAGLAFLVIGTFLGGVWANESWGRYWGWDPKETWSLITILVYALVAHLRYIPRFNNPRIIATGSLLAILSVGMTYFGVNYFLSGLHSYAEGSATGMPVWVYVMVATMIALPVAAAAVDARRSWGHGNRDEPAPKGAPEGAPARHARVSVPSEG